jgi:3-phenylpropionate/cinnamic acid dioxygenase small subunit
VTGEREDIKEMLRYVGVQRFLYAEAALLDERRFEEWLERCAPEIRYWMPAQTNRDRHDRHLTVGGPDDLPMFEETWEHLQQRVRRLATGRAWAEEPPSRTRRLVTNVRVTDWGDDGVRAQSNLLLYRTRHDADVQIFVASRTDDLRPHAVYRWQIVARTIVLDATTVPGHNLSVFF